MRSVLTVTSWWSNCLGLTCLHNLVRFTEGREIIVMQAGKSASQMAKFRELMPSGVQELLYPDHLPADDSRMREYMALDLLGHEQGAWFFDHDAFFHEDMRSWLDTADHWFDQQGICIAAGEPREGPGLTQPAYWLSPQRWPDHTSSFDPIPFHEKAHVSRPDLVLHDGDLIQPQKDTLVQVNDDLTAMGLAGTFPLTAEAADQQDLPPFPRHTHLGGIHVYTGPVTKAELLPWVELTVKRFDNFYANCPPEWLAAEEPELLRRHSVLKEELGLLSPDNQRFANTPRRELSFKFNRREFFANLGMDMRVAEGERRGGVGVKLAQLGELSDTELAPIVPQVRPDCRILLQDPYVCAQKPDAPEPVRLFRTDQATLSAFNGMNGRNPLGVIGQQVAQQMQWPPGQGFAFTRGLFLHLVQLQVVVPRVN